MPITSHVSRRRCFIALALALLAAVAVTGAPALAQDGEPSPEDTTTTTSSTDTVPPTDPSSTTTSTTAPTSTTTVPPDDPGAIEELPEEPVWVEGDRVQRLTVIEATSGGLRELTFDAVRFVPLLPGLA